MTFYWTTPVSNGGSAITGYTLTCPAISFSQVYSSSTFSAPVAGLTNGASYTFSIYATNGNGNSNPVSFIPCQPGLATPAPPTATATSVDGAGNFLVQWTAPTLTGDMGDIYRYFVRAKNMNSGAIVGSFTTYADVLQRVLPTSSFTDPYAFLVYAVNNTGYSPAAQTNTVNPPSGAPFMIVGGGAYAGINAMILYSTDNGQTFTRSTSAAAIWPGGEQQQMAGFGTNGTRFLAIGSTYFGYSQPKLGYSDDGGATWTDTMFPFEADSSALQYGSPIVFFKGKFYLYLDASDPGVELLQRIYESSNGLSWTLKVLEHSKAGYYAVANSSTVVFVNGGFQTTTNGYTLAAPSVPPSLASGQYFTSACWDGSFFYAVPVSVSGATVWKSATGNVWEIAGSASQHIYQTISVASNGRGTLVMVGQPYGPQIYSIICSTDYGASWKGVWSTGGSFFQVYWNGVNFVVQSSDGYQYYSPDGITWTYASGGTAYVVNWTMLQSNYVAPPPAGPLVSLTAATYSGSGTWTDDSGNGKNATKAAGTIAKNTAGNGIVLDGSTYWTFPNVAAGNAWSIGAWFKNTGAPVGVHSGEDACIVTQRSVTDDFNALLGFTHSVAEGTTGYPYLQGAFGLSSGALYVGTSYTVVNDVWTHYTVTWDGTTMTTYINGSSIGATTPGGTSVDVGSEYRIGRRWDAEDYVVGEIGEVQIYGRAISAAEVTTHYRNSKQTYYPIISLTASTYSGSGAWTDDTGNGYNATIAAGTAQLNADGNGLVLDGSTAWTFPDVYAGSTWTLGVWYKNTGTPTQNVNNPCILTQLVNPVAPNYSTNVSNIMLSFLLTYPELQGTFYNDNFHSGTSYTVVNNVWTYYSITYDGTTMTTYVNGSSIGSVALNTPTISSGFKYLIGSHWNLGYNYVVGEIGEVQIYRRILPAAEVLAHYNATKYTYNPLLVSLTASTYPGSGTWADDSGNGKNATKAAGTIAKNVAGNGIVLDGSTYWTFPNVEAGSVWTVGVWYKNTGTPTGGPNAGVGASVVTQEYDSGAGTVNLALGYGVFGTTSGPFQGSFLATGNGWGLGSSISIVNDQWINLQVTWDGTSLTTYVNGSSIGTVTPGFTATDSGAQYRIGRRWDNASYIVGEIGEVQIYGVPLNATRVLNHYYASAGSYYLSPTSVAGCQLWLDASDATTVVLSGSTVTQWKDKSGQGNNAIGAGSLTIASNVISTNGGTITSPYTAAPASESVFAVCGVDATGSGSVLVWPGGTGGRVLYMDSGSFNLGDNGVANFIAGTATIPVNTPILYDFTHSSTDISMFLNGTLDNSGTGSYAYTGSNPSQIKAATISEFVIYNRVLSTEERQKVEGYLAWKWGLEADLPAGHPYYNAPPT